MNNYYIALVPLLPLAAFLLLGLFGKKHFTASAGLVGTLVTLVATVIALVTAYQYFFVTGKVNGVYQQTVAMSHTWLQFSPGVSIDMGILIDSASVMMI